jgi:K+-transporting ATPase c subunit
MWKEISPGFRMMVVMTVLTGFIYPGVVTALSQVFFRNQANVRIIVLICEVVWSVLM